MKKIIISAFMLLAASTYAQVKVDSVEFRTPNDIIVHIIKEGNTRSLPSLLDSLNGIYKTDKFNLYFFHEDGKITRKCFENVVKPIKPVTTI